MFLAAIRRAALALPLLLAAQILAVQYLAAQSPPAEDGESYEVGPGDTIAVDVFRVPDLTRQVVIDINGELPYAPLGRLAVDGLGLSEIERLISAQLGELGIIEGVKVTVSLVEARPLFVSGDVSQPGAVSYRAGMTVRQAIALAGGIDPTRRSGAGDPVTQAAELEAERAALAADFQTARLAVDRLQAEIAAYRDPDVTIAEAMDRLDGNGSPVAESESALLDARLGDLTAEEQRLDEASALVELRRDSLQSEQEVERQILADQQEAFDKLDEMSSSGLVTANRIENTRGLLNDTRRRLADLTRQIGEARERLAELRNERDRLPDRRAADAEAELRDQRARLDLLEARIRGVDLRLGLLPSARRDLMVELIRPEDGDLTHLQVDLDTPLQPDDTIEVSLLSPVYGAAGGLTHGEVSQPDAPALDPVEAPADAAPPSGEEDTATAPDGAAGDTGVDAADATAADAPAPAD